MAMTAWSAKVLSSAICLSEKGRTSRASNRYRPDSNALAQKRDGQAPTEFRSADRLAKHQDNLLRVPPSCREYGLPAGQVWRGR